MNDAFCTKFWTQFSPLIFYFSDFKINESKGKNLGVDPNLGREPTVRFSKALYGVVLERIED